MPTGVDLGLSGLASGFDWKAFVTQIEDAERTPELRMLQQQSVINSRSSAYGSIKTLLTTLQTRVKALNDATIFDSRQAGTSDAAQATAAASANAALGTFNFNVTHLATAARLNGTANVGKAISDGSDLGTLKLADAGFNTAVTPGTFTVNGKQITIATSDTMQAIFDKIHTATGNDVTASYAPGTDKLTLTSASNTEIILGSGTDSSNFLQVTRLTNNGGPTVTSSQMLGGVRLSQGLATSNLGTTVTGGATGAFKVNGVTIAYDAGVDSVNNVLSRINNSAAGVTATYDSVNDRFVMTNKTTGDVGVSMQDVTGNFLAATGLAAGAIVRGTNLTYTVNGSDPLISQSNTITDASSGITGLSVTALKEGAVNVTVSSDTAKIKTIITDFVGAYNSVQAYIDNKTASTTDSKGKVTAGVLASDHDASDITNQLRKLVFTQVEGMTGAIKQLADLGIQTNGNDNTLSIKDSAALDSALANNLSGVKDLFSNSTTGISTQLNTWFEKTIGDEGSLVAHQDSLTKQSTAIDTQIATLEKRIAAQSARLTASFVNMETVRSSLNQQLSFLTSQFDKL